VLLDQHFCVSLSLSLFSPESNSFFFFFFSRLFLGVLLLTKIPSQNTLGFHKKKIGVSLSQNETRERQKNGGEREREEEEKVKACITTTTTTTKK